MVNLTMGKRPPETTVCSRPGGASVQIGERNLTVPMHVAAGGEFAATEGLAQARERLWRAVLGLYETGLFPGISVCVMHQNQPLLHRALGYARIAPRQSETGVLTFNDWCDGDGVPMRPEQPACLFSASKMVMAMLVHGLVGEGTLSLSEPIEAYLPQLLGSGLGALSLEDVLAHRTGVPSFPKGVSFDVLFDADAALKALCSVSSSEDKGTDFAYHAVTGGVLVGAIIEAMAGCSVRALLDRVLRTPLGMKVFSYGLPQCGPNALKLPAELGFVQDYLTGEKPNLLLQQWVKRLLGASLDEVIKVTRDARFREAVIPAVNLYAAPEEMCRFLQVLAQHGVYGSVPVFSPQTVSKALEPVEGWRFDKHLMLPMRYSAGFMLGANPVGLWGPFSQRSFGHLGFTNKLCWANPKSQTAVCLVPNGNCLAGAPIKAMIPFVVEVQRLAGVF